jgi:ketosteroid isomerase-like protein
MSNANVALVQGLYAAFGRGDVASIIAGLAPDVHWESGGRASDFPTFGPRKGPSEVKTFLGQVAENLDFSEFTPRELCPSGDKVFVLGFYAATMRKSGGKAACEWVHVFTLRDGKVVRFREFTDSAMLAEAYRG